jgi:hypothetical protein
MSRDCGGGGRSRALWRQLALLRDPYATPTYSMRYLRDLPQACQATHSTEYFVQPFQISKNTAPHTEKARMTFQTDLHNIRDLEHIPQFTFIVAPCISMIPLFSYTNLCNCIYITKTLKHFVHLIAPTCFDTQRVIIRELHFPG